MNCSAFANMSNYLVRYFRGFQCHFKHKISEIQLENIPSIRELNYSFQTMQIGGYRIHEGIGQEYKRMIIISIYVYIEDKPTIISFDIKVYIVENDYACAYIQ